MRTVYTPPEATSPYADAQGRDGFQRYKYRGEDPEHPENRALRRAHLDGLPLIWFVGVQQGVYLPIYPVWVVGDEPQRLQSVLALEPMFRARVLAASNTRCTVCRLRHAELLDAAHIIPDGKPHGDPVVPNGLSMCKIHHAAFDSNILGIRPDLSVHVRQDVLDEIDGPMLRHGLQGMHNQRLQAPTLKAAKPSEDRLEERYAEFLSL